jgi:hypothetical protein
MIGRAMPAKMEPDLANGLEKLMWQERSDMRRRAVTIPDIAPLIRATWLCRYVVFRS